MIPLPVDAQARIERTLAELELVAIEVQQHPPQMVPYRDRGNYIRPSETDIIQTLKCMRTLELVAIEVQQHPPQMVPNGDGGYYYTGASPTDIMRTAVVIALAQIVDVVMAARLSAADRRQIVAAHQDQLLTLYASERPATFYDLHRPSFIETLRSHDFWVSFQKGLREAERTDVPSLGQQLESFRQEVPISIGDLSIATGRSGRTIHPRTIERHLKDAPMGPSSIRTYQETLTQLLGRKITFVLPPVLPGRRRTGKKPVKRR